MTKVKVCGITRLEDAQAAAEAGADAIGFVFADSPRSITPEQARDIRRALASTRCVTVGVFVNDDVDRMTAVAEFVGLHALQLHGEESPEIVEKITSLHFEVIKSFRLSAERNSVERLATYRVSAYLLDTFVPGKPGGTGETFDWTLALGAKHFGRIILAGGLGVDNVREAIRVVSPYGVDASSRLERRPGVKDHDLVREFIRAVRLESRPCRDDSENVPWLR